MFHTWGTSEVVYQTPQIVVVQAKARVIGAASSLHYHREHDNLLHVSRGSVLLDYGDADCPQSMATIRLKRGDSFKAMAGVAHRIRFDEECDLVEMYHPRGFVPATIADIIRLQPGWEAGMELPGQVA